MDDDVKRIVTVADLIESLQAFPATAHVQIYSGWANRDIDCLKPASTPVRSVPPASIGYNDCMNNPHAKNPPAASLHLPPEDEAAANAAEEKAIADSAATRNATSKEWRDYCISGQCAADARSQRGSGWADGRNR